jgi:hypothetical protein
MNDLPQDLYPDPMVTPVLDPSTWLSRRSFADEWREWIEFHHKSVRFDPMLPTSIY